MTAVKSFFGYFKVFCGIMVLLGVLLISQGCGVQTTTYDSDGNVVTENTIDTDTIQETLSSLLDQ